MPPRDPPIAPMTLGNMRHNGVRAVVATCRGCKRSVEVVVDQLGDEVFVPDAGLRMRCSTCGHRGAETVPAWRTRRAPGMGEPR